MAKMRTTMVSVLTSLWLAGAIASAQNQEAHPRKLVMSATAYSIHGEQRSGTIAKEGTAAADPRVLPLGTRVRVHGNHGYIGELVITDTGRRVKGHTIDIFFDSREKARRFGRQRVTVEILELGGGPASAREEVREGVTPPKQK